MTPLSLLVAATWTGVAVGLVRLVVASRRLRRARNESWFDSETGLVRPERVADLLIIATRRSRRLSGSIVCVSWLLPDSNAARDAGRRVSRSVQWPDVGIRLGPQRVGVISHIATGDAPRLDAVPGGRVSVIEVELPTEPRLEHEAARAIAAGLIEGAAASDGSLGRP